MAGGPITPSSVYLGGASGNLSASYYTGGGGNASSHEEGITVIASLPADAVAELRFPMPSSIPTGTLKLMVRTLANASTGTAKWTVSDGSCGTGVSPSATTLTSETQSILSWTTGDNHNYKDIKVTLSTTPSVNDDLIVAITFQFGTWTLAQNLTCLVWVLWE